MRRFTAFALATAFAALAGCQAAGQVTPATARRPAVHGHEVSAATAGVQAAERAAAQQILVKLKPGLEADLEMAGVRRVRTIPGLGWAVVEAEGSPAAALARLKRDPAVAACEPQRLMKLHEAPRFNDPAAKERDKHHARIQLEKAWALTTGKPNVVVAVLDTGIDPNHPDLAPNLVPGYDTVNHDATPEDDHSHGTACAGIIAAVADNHLGIMGMAPHCKVMPVKVLNRRGVGPLEWAAEGIVWAADHGASIVTMSFGEDEPSQVLQEAVDYARKKNVLLIASMGNDGEERKHWPAACDGVLAVGATYDDDTPTLFTTWGDWVGVAAPGTRVYTTMPTYPLTDPMLGKRKTHYDHFSGTSASGPVVGAVAALVRSARPELNEAAVRELLKRSADDVGDPGFDKLSGHGRVNAWRALSEPSPAKSSVRR